MYGLAFLFFILAIATPGLSKVMISGTWRAWFTCRILPSISWGYPSEPFLVRFS